MDTKDQLRAIGQILACAVGFLALGLFLRLEPGSLGILVAVASAVVGLAIIARHKRRSSPAEPPNLR